MRFAKTRSPLGGSTSVLLDQSNREYELVHEWRMCHCHPTLIDNLLTQWVPQWVEELTAGLSLATRTSSLTSTNLKIFFSLLRIAQPQITRFCLRRKISRQIFYARLYPFFTVQSCLTRILTNQNWVLLTSSHSYSVLSVVQHFWDIHVMLLMWFSISETFMWCC